MRGGNFRLTLRSDAGGNRIMILADPEGAVDLRYTGASVARTLLASAGGLEVNNADTGGGFERVLTVSDLGGGAPIDSVFGRTGNIIAEIGDYAGIAETYTALEIFEGGIIVDGLSRVIGSNEFHVEGVNDGEYVRIRHDGTQGLISTAGGFGGNLVLSSQGGFVDIHTSGLRRLNTGATRNLVTAWLSANFRSIFTNTTNWEIGSGLSGVILFKAPLNMEDRLLSRAELKDYALTKHNETSSSGVLTIDMSLGNSVQYTFTENVTSVVITNPPASGKHGEIWLRLVQHASSPKTIVHASKYHFPGGSDHVMTAVNSALDILHYVTVDGGATYDVTFVKDSK